MIIYSLVPAKAYSKTLLAFAYKKPLYTLVAFVVFLFASTLLVPALVGFSVPLAGSTNSVFPTSLIQGATMSVFISAGFQLPFWLAIAAASLCVAAKLFHKRVVAVREQDVTFMVAPQIAPLITHAKKEQ